MRSHAQAVCTLIIEPITPLGSCMDQPRRDFLRLAHGAVKVDAMSTRQIGIITFTHTGIAAITMPGFPTLIIGYSAGHCVGI